jgi:hypothetical protein
MRRERGEEGAGAARAEVPGHRRGRTGAAGVGGPGAGGGGGAATGESRGGPAEGGQAPAPAPGWRWIDLLGDVAEELPVDLGRPAGGRGVERRLAGLPGFGVETGEDGLRWIVGRLPLGGVGAALGAANFTWALVYHLGAPAVLVVRVSSAGELQVEVRQAEGERLTWGALAVAAGALRAGRRLGEPQAAPSEEGGAEGEIRRPEARAQAGGRPAGTEAPAGDRPAVSEGPVAEEPPARTRARAAKVLPREALERELAGRAGWELAWEPTGPVAARFVECDGFFAPWVLLNLAAPGLATTWPEVEWLVEVGPRWAAVSLAPAEGTAPSQWLLAAVDWVEALASGFASAGGTPPESRRRRGRREPRARPEGGKEVER